MKVRKLLVTDIRCRRCDAGPGEACAQGLGTVFIASGSFHGQRIADHAELERAGWEWQEVNPTDKGAR